MITLFLVEATQEKKLLLSDGEDWQKCFRKWGPAALCSKANKVARLVERKVCNWCEGGQIPVQRPTPHRPPTTSGPQLLYSEGGGYMQKQHSQL